MKAAVNGLLFLLLLFSYIDSTAQIKDYYELRIYHCSDSEQINRLDFYLKNGLIPLAHKNGISNVGVFKPIGIDTAAVKNVFVLTSAKNLVAFENLNDAIVKDQSPPSRSYLNVAHDKAIYDRIESSWLRAFEDHLELNIPLLAGDDQDHIFELRSYEAASELLYRKKVDMFNAGGEIDLFESLGFNAVFYAETLTGKHTPNLWYMTSHANMDSREKNWDAFRNDPRWDKMKSIPKYQNTVSHIDLYLLKATEYSDIK